MMLNEVLVVFKCRYFYKISQISISEEKICSSLSDIQVFTLQNKSLNIEMNVYP